MLDPRTVLNMQTLVYTIYVLAIMSLVGWFAYNVTRTTAKRLVRPGAFYTYVIVLVVIGVSLHLFTRAAIPWKEMDLKGTAVQADQTFHIEVADHKFQLPQQPLQIKKGQVVRFDVTSRDLTYGFGLFRQDNTMLWQMQVVPGHSNQFAWVFDVPGSYTIRSTEYSGPKGLDMTLKDAVVVSE